MAILGGILSAILFPIIAWATISCGWDVITSDREDREGLIAAIIGGIATAVLAPGAFMTYFVLLGFAL